MNCVEALENTTNYIRNFIPDYHPQYFPCELVPMFNDWIPISENMMMQVIGSPGSGKSFFIKQLLSMVDESALLFVASPTASLDVTHPYKGLKCQVKFYDTLMKALTALDEYLIMRATSLRVRFIHDNMKDTIKYRKEEDLYKSLPHDYLKAERRIFLVVDDCASEPKNKFVHAKFISLITRRRHLNVNIIVGCQSYTQLHKDDRRGASEIVLTKGVGMDDIEIVHKSMGAVCETLKATSLSSIKFAQFINWVNNQFLKNGSKYYTWIFTASKLFIMSDTNGLDEVTSTELQDMVRLWKNNI